MRVHRLSESLISALLIYLQLAHTRLHHLVLALLLTLYELHLKLATGCLVLNAIDKLGYLLGSDERGGNLSDAQGATSRRYSSV